MSLVLLAQRRNLKEGKECLGFALVITPLNSMIEDQMQEAYSMDLTACSLAEQIVTIDEVLSGKYMLVYASPESATDIRFLRLLKKPSCFRDNLVVCVVDETHTEETWTGMRDKKSKVRLADATAFRAAYGNIAVMRLFLNEGTPFAALTGTADVNTLATVTKELTLNNPLVIQISPNRENIRFSVIKAKEESILSNLDWLVESIQLHVELMPKTIIFCNTVEDIACVINYLLMKLGKAAFSPQEGKEMKNCLIGIYQYQSFSWEHRKEKLLNSLKGEMKTRVVIASSALSTCVLVLRSTK